MKKSKRADSHSKKAKTAAKSLEVLTSLAMLQTAKKVVAENKRFGEPLIVWKAGKKNAWSG